MGLLTHYSNMVEAGCDEAGRGCLTGPVVAAAVILKNGTDYPLKLQPELLLIDGNRFNPYKKIKHICVVGGDAKYQSIAAASILAKTTRDMMMVEYDQQYPVYNWKKNKGYPTPEHKQAIADYGTTPLHRMTFNMAIQLKLDF